MVALSSLEPREGVTKSAADSWVAQNRKLLDEFGLACDIVGGVRARGGSTNDLDLKITENEHGDLDGFLERLAAMGFSIDRFSCGYPRATIETPDGKMIDLF